MDGFQRFLADPRKAWQERLAPTESWARGLTETLGRAKPNAGHRVFAELERVGRCGAVITQNIDDLHRQAGTRSLLEIHGNHRLLRCLDCVARFDPERHHPTTRTPPERLAAPWSRPTAPRGLRCRSEG